MELHDLKFSPVMWNFANCLIARFLVKRLSEKDVFSNHFCASFALDFSMRSQLLKMRAHAKFSVEGIEKGEKHEYAALARFSGKKAFRNS